MIVGKRVFGEPEKQCNNHWISISASPINQQWCGKSEAVPWGSGGVDGSKSGKLNGNVRSMTTKKKKPDKEKNLHETQSKLSWMNSWAKEILQEAIMKGDNSPEHAHNKIHKWHPEVELTNQWKLPGHVWALWQQVVGDFVAAKANALVLEHDQKLHPIPTHNQWGKQLWQGSEVQRLLQVDITSKIHLTMKPFQFHNS